MNRARVVTLNAALGPLDYRVPDGMHVEPGSVLVAPLGPRQLLGVAWEPERLPSEEVGENRLRPIVGTLDVPPIAAPLRRLAEWTADSSSRAARVRVADDPAFIECARRPEAVERVSADRSRAGPDDSAAAKGAGGARRAAGYHPRARRPCRGQRHGDARVGHCGRARGG